MSDTPINVKDLFGQRFRIGLDPAALLEVGGKNDPWYFTVKCQYGEIYPFSDKLLAIHSKGPGIRQRLSEIPAIKVNKMTVDAIEVHNWSDDGEAIFIFPLSLFDRVAEIVKPRRKRHGSRETGLRLAELGRACRFKPKSAGIQLNLEAQNAPIVPKSTQTTDGSE